MPPLIDAELRLRLSATEAVIAAVSDDLRNPEWAKAEARILILRLSPFKDVEESSSHLVLFAECREALPEAFIDFGFFPGKKDRAILSSLGLSPFYGLESGRSPADFDLILVSNAFALELVNLGYLYSGTGLPRRASGRAAAGAAAATDGGKGIPIVILGGSNAAACGSLLFRGGPDEESSDSLVDGIFFGEGEGAIGELAAALARPGASRAARLEAASPVEGLWLALSGKAASRRIVKPFPPQLIRYPVLNSGNAATARLQISAGCPGFCSFCLEGWESRPYRELPVEEILRAARALKAASGASGIEVYSYNFNTHGKIFELLLELNRVFRRVNFMSQRLDILAESPALAGAELAADKRSFTLGIEGVSDRMRRYYRKGIDSGQIDAAIARLALPAVRELKLSYILSGFENEADIAEFAEFAHRCAEARRRSAPGQRIIVSAGYLTRLPFTPLQHAPLCLDRGRMEAIAQRVEGACAAAEIEFRLAADFEEYYADQLLALGGRDLAPWLERTPEAGVSCDGGLSRGAASALEAFAASAGFVDAAFLAEKGADWRSPLAFIDDNRAALWKQYSLASSFARNASGAEALKAPDAEWLGRLERVMRAKRGFASTLVRLSLPASLAQATAEYRASWIMRAVSAASREGGGASVFDAEEALFSKGGRLEGLADRFWGLAYFRLRGPEASRMEAAAAAAGLELARELPACAAIEAEVSFPAARAREAEAALKAQLAESRVSFVESRRGGSRLLVPSVRDSKKRILIGAELLAPDSGGNGSFVARLSLGPKASLAAWLARLDYAAARSASVRILGYGEGESGAAASTPAL
jgi:hypothetical protein